MLHYEFWVHRAGEKYLIRLDDANGVTGVCGPLRQANVPVANRFHFDYDAQPEHTAWVRAHANEFHCIDAISV